MDEFFSKYISDLIKNICTVGFLNLVLEHRFVFSPENFSHINSVKFWNIWLLQNHWHQRKHWVHFRAFGASGGVGQNQKPTMRPILCIHDAVPICGNEN